MHLYISAGDPKGKMADWKMDSIKEKIFRSELPVKSGQSKSQCMPKKGEASKNNLVRPCKAVSKNTGHVYLLDCVKKATQLSPSL